MSRLAPLIVVLVAGVLALAGIAASRASSNAPGIDNIVTFLEQCPTTDPAYAQIRADFEIRREGIVVGEISCTEPVSAMPVAQYTDELIAVQTLRTIYYMEGGRNVEYPWTSGSLYDWMKAKTGGIDLTWSGSSCCASYNDQWFPRLATQSAWDRDTDREWPGISNQITVLAHEVRHIDGFPHVGGCPLFPLLSYGCDAEYSESNLAPYAIEWWLNWKWLTGELYVGFSCASAPTVLDIAGYHQTTNNGNYALRFVGASPPALSVPPQPGGPCQATGQTAAPTASPTLSPTPTAAPSPSATAAPTPAPTASPLPTVTASPATTVITTATPPPPQTPTPTASASAGLTLTPTASLPVSGTSGVTVSPSDPPAPTLTATPMPLPPPLARANVNCDGATDKLDLLLLLGAAVGLRHVQPSGCGMPGETLDGITLGDVDCDGVFGALDVLALLRYLGGLPLGDC
jgi:hypothetical protein